MRFLIKVIFFYILILLWMSSCAPVHYAPKSSMAPQEPIIFPVEIIDHRIEGKNVDNVITNWLNQLQYSEDLKAKGNFIDFAKSPNQSLSLNIKQ